MALPKLDTPIHSLKLPSTGDVVKFRPFLVKEEKILLTALESQDENTIIEAVKQIINNCLLTDGIDIEQMPMFDIEYFFLQLRAKSVSDVVTLRYKNNACTFDEGKPCGKELQVMVKLDEIEVTKAENHQTKIQLNENIGVIMKYPTMEIMTKYQDTADKDSLFGLIAECVNTIFDKDEVYSPDSFTKEELEDFILSMTQQQFEKIREFFETMPQLKKTVNVSCKKCGYNREVTLTGLKDFFV